MRVEVLQWSSDRTCNLLFDFKSYPKYFTPYQTTYGGMGREITTQTIETVLTKLNLRRIDSIRHVTVVKNGKLKISKTQFTVWVIKD
jgi:hypothetical protein